MDDCSKILKSFEYNIKGFIFSLSNHPEICIEFVRQKNDQASSEQYKQIPKFFATCLFDNYMDQRKTQLYKFIYLILQVSFLAAAPRHVRFASLLAHARLPVCAWPPHPR